MIDIEGANAELLAAGFVRTGATFGSEFIKELDGKWAYYAYCSRAEGTDAKYEYVTLGLVGTRDKLRSSKGTRHRISSSLDALRISLPIIVDRLRELASNPQQMTCPECGDFVHLKEPHNGQNWAPFLSCDGMEVVGRGAKKRVRCRGTNNLVPDLVHY